jgi:hypothetical protein
MSELYQLENNTLYVPYVEAKNLKEKSVVNLLFKIPQVKIFGKDMNFNFNNAEPVYPIAVSTQLKNLLKIEDKDMIIEGNKKLSYRYVEFWHFLGDGTHYSEPIPTPYNFYPGKELLIENKYNYKAVKCVVTDISLVRVTFNEWFWNIQIHKIDNEV